VSKYEHSWNPKRPWKAPGDEKSYWINQVRVEGFRWKRYQQAYREAKRLDAKVTWSSFVRDALDVAAEKALKSSPRSPAG
jgi:hypothetical protein